MYRVLKTQLEPQVHIIALVLIHYYPNSSYTQTLLITHVDL